jgi:hypothetical protein
VLGFRLIVGPEAIAAFDVTALRLAVSRSDLSPRWQGRIYASPLEWTGRSRLLIRIGQRERSVGVWDVSTGTVTWKASGDAACWGEMVAVVTWEGELEIRDGANGGVSHRGHLGGKAPGTLLAVDDLLLRILEGDLSGIDLRSCRTAWTASLREMFSGLPQDGVQFRSLLPCGEGRALLRFHTNYGLVDISSGRLIWRRFIPTDHLPLVTREQLGFLYNGRVLVLNTASGEPLVERDRAVETLWESRPCLHENRMVAVDPGGHIVTLDIRSGRPIGIQRERAANFSDCFNVDGRLLVSDLDGAVWVYEPSDRPRGSSPGMGGTAALARGGRLSLAEPAAHGLTDKKRRGRTTRARDRKP